MSDSPPPGFAELAAAQYVLLTTFRKDGSAVGTPVWAVGDRQQLLVWTATDSYKVKRLRRDPRLTLAICDARGRPRSEAVPGTGVVLDAEGSERTRTLIARKYGIVGRVLMLGSVLRRGRSGTVGVACTLDRGGDGDAA